MQRDNVFNALLPLIFPQVCVTQLKGVQHRGKMKSIWWVPFLQEVCKGLLIRMPHQIKQKSNNSKTSLMH